MKRMAILLTFLVLGSPLWVAAQETLGTVDSVIAPVEQEESAGEASIGSKELSKSDEFLDKAFDHSGLGVYKARRTPKPLPLEIDPLDDDSGSTSPGRPGFDWKHAVAQSMLFLGVQHGFALATQEKTRRSLHGKFFKDYGDSLRSLHGWDDGGRFFTNYIAHPMQGSFLGFIQVQNDPKGRGVPISNSRAYWKSRLKAMTWTAAWSTQFELGPISQASIGNIGLSGKQTWGDIVITPTLGTALLIGEDALDRYLLRKLERGSKSYAMTAFLRMLFNPTRSIANMARLKYPWHRDKGLR